MTSATQSKAATAMSEALRLSGGANQENGRGTGRTKARRVVGSSSALPTANHVLPPAQRRAKEAALQNVDAMKKVSSAGVPYASEASAQMTALKPLMQQRRPRAS